MFTDSKITTIFQAALYLALFQGIIFAKNSSIFRMEIIHSA